MDTFTVGDRLRGLTPGEAAETREHLRVIAQLRRTQARIDGEIAKRTARLAAIAHRQGEAMGDSHGPEYARRSMSAEIAAATNVHPTSARAQLDTSERLLDGFPATSAALSQGRITQRHAKVALDAGANLDDGARASLDAHVVGLAEGRTPGELAKIAKLSAARLAPKSLRERHEEARAERGVAVRDLDDGMSEMILILPTFHANAIHDRLTNMAKRINDERRAARRAFQVHAGASGRPRVAKGEWGTLFEQADASAFQAAASATCGIDGVAFTGSGEDLGVRASDTRTFDQIRVDLLADILLTAAPTGHELHSAGTAEALGSIQATVQVTIPAKMLIDPARGIAWNDRGGIVSPDAALSAAGKAAGWDRLFVAPDTGEILATDRYRPTADQRRRLNARDGTCRFKGCTTPARRCDIDHTHDHAIGGPTHIENLESPCERHHMMKHQSGWRVRQTGGGGLDWVGPTGEMYPDEPISGVMFRESVAEDHEPPWATDATNATNDGTVSSTGRAVIPGDVPSPNAPTTAQARGSTLDWTDELHCSPRRSE